jgi:uncharacterized protein with HEPN domain
MRLESKALLEDVLTAAEAIARLTQHISFEEYLDSEAVRGAVKYHFIIVSEALSQLSRVDPPLAQQISKLPQIVAFRNRLVHGYRTVEESVVWGIIELDLDDLLIQVRRLLAEPDDPP